MSVTLLLIASAPASSQGLGNEMAIEGRILISGLTSLDGSATVTVTYSGDTAGYVREATFDMFDDSGDQWMGVEEVRSFLEAVCSQMLGKIVWGFSVDSTTNFSEKSNAYVLDHTSGLVDSEFSATDPISFTLSFEGSGSMSSREVEAGEGLYEALSVSVAAATGYRHDGWCTIDLRVSAFVVGSFSSPHLEEGDMSAIRTPMGDIMWYSFSGDANALDPISDKVTYRVFSIMDNQQIAFVALLICLLLILRTPSRDFDKFEKLHPKKFRKYAKPLIVVWVSAIALAAVCVVLYVLPFLFAFSSPNTYIFAGYLYVVLPLAVIAEHFFSKIMYGRAALNIPDESSIEIKQAMLEPEAKEGEWLCKSCYMPIEETLDIFQCSCGATMHVKCAERAQTCPMCGAVLFPQLTRSIECKACGESFLYSGNEDGYSIQCTKCGAFQEQVVPGKNYLIVDEDPHNAFTMIRALGKTDRQAMCLTTQFPGKVRSDFDMESVEIKWFSDSTTDIDNVNPKDLDGDPMEIVSTFLMTTKGAGVMIEGVDTLIEFNGFEKVLNFIKKINDLASTHRSTIILSVDKKKLTESQFKAISEQFDETHDFQ
ncbi:MAG: hypothetical protein A3K76_04460 [Euryarchaeota archaeon RBG_13_57_23]|nr:MAG: hypothetical protein A3K76_04460 [Euryarchaeota archaeon RBG_13_57_23]